MAPTAARLRTPKPAHKTSLSAPLRALRHRSLLTMSLTALCYNWGFFTVLSYAPFPMNLSPIKLGLVFTGWGVLVAIFAVFGAPRLQASLGIARTMYLDLFAFGIVILSTSHGPRPARSRRAGAGRPRRGGGPARSGRGRGGARGGRGLRDLTLTLRSARILLRMAAVR